MTFEEKLILEETEELRKKGLIGPNETVFDFSRRISEESGGCLPVDALEDQHTQDEIARYTRDKLVELCLDTNVKSISVGSKVLKHIEEMEARQHG